MKHYSIVFDKVTKIFPKASRPSVNEASLRIEEGSFVTILGASGCGKTTLLKMVNRLYEPTSGRIFVQGEDVSRMQVTRLRRKIGYVIQQVGLFPHMTIEENIATVPRILGWDKKRIDERIDELLELVHLPPGEFRKRYPRQLSGGQQQRVGLARAMAGDPAIMLMDEPFGAIDAITRASLQDELIHIQKKLHKTILFVTHDIEEALKLGDKIVIMNEGKIQQYDTPFNIITKPANEFVRRLVHSDDVLKRLSVMKAASVMTEITGHPHPNEIRVSLEENCKTILTHLLQSEQDSVIVVDSNKTPVGRVTLEQLKIHGALSGSASAC
ncbi:osmoprotectant transport system ATP-binding protein [Planifilum fulgidum]|uniref:Quaternary amine transport ATP-binding protein n=1 Tax=Planifilum fulgidum TaxID=201973 RepID=A0A1I2LAH4_9BACL|nr:ABC transporter ATP-binding protein [Planifilum fulgidum]MBO2495769.1 ABC transporter ATP-binding protein [Bacillota bacterium]SFF74497.1 osmoprotectant transport system ATP-binding protein [Planifilum fulgidum]